MIKKITFGLLLIFLAAAANAAPTAQIIVNGGLSITTAGVTVLIKGSDSITINQYALIGDITDEDPEWENLPTPSKNISLTLSKTLVNPSATNNLYLKFRNVSLIESAQVSAQVYYDFNPTGGPVLAKAVVLGKQGTNVNVSSKAGINNPITNIWFSAFDDVSVSNYQIYGDFDLTPITPTVNEYPITASIAFFHAYNNTIPTQNIKTVKFTAGEGTKNFTVVFYDNASNQSNLLSYSVFLDETPPYLITANQIAPDLLAHPTIPDYTNQISLLQVRVQSRDDLSGVANSGISHYQYILFEVTPYEGESPFVVKSGTVSLGQNGFPSTDNDYEATLNVTYNIKTSGEKYYFEIRAVDLGGNLSEPFTTNTIGVDSGSLDGNGNAVNRPENPFINYPSGIVVNRPIMDIDFFDKQTGIKDVYVKIRRGSTDALTEDLVSFNQSLIEKAISEAVSFTREICTAAYSDFTTVTVNGTANVVEVFHPATCNTQQFTGTANHTLKGYNNNWTVPATTWDQIEESQQIDFVFQQYDRIGNLNDFPAFGDPNAVTLQFSKDTIAPSGLALNYVNNQVLFNGTQVPFSVRTSLDTKFYMIAANLLTTASFVTDYSFEDAGYLGTRNSDWVIKPFIGDGITLDARVTGDVVYMVNANGNAVNSIYSLDQVPRVAFDGNFGLRLKFNLPIGTPGFSYNEVQWGGLEKSITLNTLTSSTNYSIYTGILLAESMGGRQVCLSVDSYSGVTLSSTAVLKCLNNLSASWRLLGGVVTLNAGVDRLVARVSFTPTRNLYSSPVIDPLNIYNPINANNAFYVDQLLVLKGRVFFPTETFDNDTLVAFNVPKNVTVNLNTVSATYNSTTFTMAVRDQVGNWAFVTKNITVDSVTPAMLAVGVSQFTTGNDTLKINLSADDFGGSGIRRFYLKIMNERDNTQFYPTFNGYVTFNALTTTDNLSITLTTGNADTKYQIGVLDPAGIYRVYAYVDDKVSNNSAIVTSSAMTVDTLGPSTELIFDAPTVNETSPGVFRYSGWYDNPAGIGITINATDDFVTTNILGTFTVTGSGVAIIHYVINEGPTQSIAVSTGSVSFRLTQEGLNTFKYWAQDALGQSSAVVNIKPPFTINETITVNGQLANQYYGNFIANSAVSVTANLTFGLYGFYLDTLPPTITSNLVNDTWLGMDNAPSFTLNDLGAGVKYIYYQIDSNPAQAMTVDGDLIGTTSFNYPLTTSINSITQEGFYSLSYWAVDKFGHSTSVNTVSLFKNDRGRPQITISALSSIQGRWITANAGISINFSAVDFFETPVVYDPLNYPFANQTGSYFAPPVTGLASLSPGSGPTKTNFWFSVSPSVTASVTLFNDNLLLAGNLGQFGYVSSLVVTKNGINYLPYQVSDLAGNVNAFPQIGTINPNPLSVQSTFDALNNAWVITPTYNGDVSLIRDLKIDTEAPSTGSFLINKYAVHPSYNLNVQYTSGRTVVLNLDHLRDSGIGVRYIYITGDVEDDFTGASTILNPSPNAPLSEQFDVSTHKPSDTAYAPVNRWFELPLKKLNGAGDHDPDSPSGMVDETLRWPLRDQFSARIYVTLTAGDGPKNIQVYVGDDFILGNPVFDSGINAALLTPNQTWRMNHMMLLGAQTVIYDSQVLTPQVTVQEAQPDGSVGTKNINLKIDAAVLGDLSGIDAVYVDGEVTGNNVRQWVSYVRHPSGAIGEDFMLLPIVLSEYEGTKNISIKLRDKAGNMWDMMSSGFTSHSKNESPTLIIPVFYDQPMICNQSLGRKITWVTDSKPSYFWFRVPTWDVTIDCTGVNRVVVSGNVKNFSDGITVNNPLGINFNRDNRIYLDDSVDGLKSVYFYLHDRGSIVDISNQLVLLDRVAPQVTTNAQTVNFYTDFTGAKINISARDPMGASVNEVANIKEIVYRINNGVAQTVNFESLPIPGGTSVTASVTVNISTEGINNSLRFYAVDKAGNTSNEIIITGIKVNRTPPTGQFVNSLSGTQYNNHYYTNSNRVTLDILAYDTDWMDISGDVLGAPYTVSYNSRIEVTITAGQGTKNININFRDQSYSDPNTFNVKVYYDNQAPAAPIISSLVPTLSNLATLVITGNIETLSQFSASQLVTVSVTANNQFRAVIRLVPGNNSLSFTATDLAGNISAPTQISVSLNSQAWVETLSGTLPTGVIGISISDVSTSSAQVLVANENLTQSNPQAITYLGATIRDFSLVTTAGFSLQDSINVFSQEEIYIVIPFSQQAAMLGKPKNFRIFYLNPAVNRWELVPGQQIVDLANRTVKVRVSHFSIYGLGEITPATNDNGLAKVFPNPFIAGDGILDNGELGAGDGVYFDDTTAGAEIKIYTLSGALVKKLTASANGYAVWEINNESGEYVSSGIYLYTITGNKTKKTGRITVIRK